MRFPVRRSFVLKVLLVVLGYVIVLNIHSSFNAGSRFPWQRLDKIEANGGSLSDVYSARSVRSSNQKFHTHIRKGISQPPGSVRNNGKVMDTLFNVQGQFKFNPVGGSSNRDFPIFPHETDQAEDDRIWNQMRYVPHQIVQGTSTTKTILLYNGIGGEKRGRIQFEGQKCPVQNCILTDDRSQATSADVILWQNTVFYPFHRRPANQIWAIFLLESPIHTPGLQAFKGQVNWSATYLHDSTIVAPYYKFTPYDPAVQRKKQTRNYATGKTKKVAWFVSNCNANNNRDIFAKELAKHIQVDIFGACGSSSCPRSQSHRCFEMLKKEYKFYLAFENSNCRDYITEKFFLNGLSNDVLPIVMGAHPKEYLRQAPPNSYIHVEDFESAAHLAVYLKELDKDDTKYNSYFEWKGTGLVDTNTFFWCRLCMMAHEALNTRNTVQDMHLWWHENTCIRGRWTTANAHRSVTNRTA